MTDYINRFASEYGLEIEQAREEVKTDTERAVAFKQAFDQAQKDRIQRFIQKQTVAKALDQTSKQSPKESSKQSPKLTPEEKALVKQDALAKKAVAKAEAKAREAEEKAVAKAVAKAEAKAKEAEEKAVAKAREAEEKAVAKAKEAEEKAVAKAEAKAAANGSSPRGSNGSSPRGSKGSSPRGSNGSSPRGSKESKGSKVPSPRGSSPEAIAKKRPSKRAKVVTEFNYEPTIKDISEHTAKYLQIALYYLMNYKNKNIDLSEEMISSVFQKKYLQQIVWRLREVALGTGEAYVAEIDDYIQSMEIFVYDRPVIFSPIPADFQFSSHIRFAYWALSQTQTQTQSLSQSLSQSLIERFCLRDTSENITRHVLTPPEAEKFIEDQTDTLSHFDFDQRSQNALNRSEEMNNSLNDSLNNSFEMNNSDVANDSDVFDFDQLSAFPLHQEDELNDPLDQTFMDTLMESPPPVERIYRVASKEQMVSCQEEEEEEEESNANVDANAITPSFSCFEMELVNQLRVYNENVAGIISLLRQKRPRE